MPAPDSASVHDAAAVIGEGGHRRHNPACLPQPEVGLNCQILEFGQGRGFRFSGLTAVDVDGAVVGVGCMEAQVKQVYANASAALASVGLTWREVTHVAVFTTDIESYIACEGSEVRALFDGCPPASTVVEVVRLIDPEWVVEVQVDAVATTAEP